MQLQTATRKKSYLKLNLSAPSGAGKTMGALLMAKGLVGDWGKIAVIDTENGSASLYSDLGPFQTIDLAPPYAPERYIQAIDLCMKAGIECIVIDSSTHEWSGPGGCIEMNENLAQSKYRGNTWSAWNETTPRHDAFVQKVLQSRCHMITCTRSKMETVMGEDKKVKKLGMKDIQRDGWEYELTVSLTIDRDTHKAIASKDRTRVFEKLDPFMITEETGRLIKDWCESGAALAPEPVAEDTREELTETHSAFDKVKAALTTGYTMEQVEGKYKVSAEVKALLTKLPEPPANAEFTPTMIVSAPGQLTTLPVTQEAIQQQVAASHNHSSPVDIF